MIKKILCICGLLALCGVYSAHAGIELKVNGTDVEEGQTLNLFKDDASGSGITFSTPADKETISAEISLDSGRRWEKMVREGEIFTYRHRPGDDEKMVVVCMFVKESGTTSMRSANVTVYYQKNRPEESIALILEKMKGAYEAEQKGRFMDLFSLRFPDKIKFEESIQNDFYNYNNIRLFYRVDRRTIDTDAQGAIWNVYWERKYMTRNGNDFTDSANIAMKFNKETSRWLVAAMNGNTIFGSSLLSSPDLTLTTTDISGGYVGFDYVITAIIHNNGQVAASVVPVQFTYSGGAALTGTESIATVAANSTTTVSHSFGAIVPGGGDAVRITIDPGNAISEDNENNNVATKSFPF